MVRSILLATTLLGIVLVVSFSINRSNSLSSTSSDDCTSGNYTETQPASSISTTCDGLNFGPNGDGSNPISASGMTIFSMSELRHYLCALEVKKRNISEIIIQESAVACTKTIPEYLAEPTCK